MPLGLDHVVHVVRDLDAAGAAFQALGFQVGVRNRHPWGTANRIVQFPGFFIELLTVEDAALIPPSRRGVISFGGFCKSALRARGEGLAMLVLESRDAEADRAAFDAAGIGGFAPFSFRRIGKRPDGREVEVGFSMAFARHSTEPQCGFFACQQHNPENFWNSDFQRHDNGATAIKAVVMVAENPSDHHIFFSSFAGTRQMRSTSLGLIVDTPRGAIEVIDPHAYRGLFGLDWPARRRRLSFAGLRLQASLQAAQHFGAIQSPDPARLVVPPARAHGVLLSFESMGTI